MKFILTIVMLVSFYNCSPYGPNYNQGKTHNQEKANRKDIVMKEDARVKKAMIKHRKRVSPIRLKSPKKRRNRKYI